MIFDNQITDAIKNSSNVAIFTHVRPDADCYGAASALKQILIKMNKNADIYCDGIVSENYSFIKHIPEVNCPELKSYDTAIAVDCSDLQRLGKYAELFKSIENTIKIDHHKTNENFGKLNYVQLVGSTCEMLFYLFKKLNVEFNADIANSLYAGVSSDTGCFMHNSTTSETHTIAGELIKYNFDLEKANYYLFKRKTLGQVNLLKTALSNMQLLLNNKLAITYLTMHDYKLAKCDSTESFGIVDICVNIDVTDIGVLISETKAGLYACSFRSKNNIDVSKIAEAFGGGGHKNASGCNIFGTYNTVIKKITEAVKSCYDRFY